MSSRPSLAIVAGVRTPFSKVYGPLKSLKSDELGVVATQGLLNKFSISPDDIDESIWGNVSGQPDAANLGRVIALKAGLPHTCIGHTVNRNCASGMEAVISSWQALCDRRSKVILTGGTESMSNVPLMYNKAGVTWFEQLQGKKTAWSQFTQFLRLRPQMLFNPVPGLKLGLTDPVCKLNMGETAENLVREFNISREAQDSFALVSHQRVQQAIEKRIYAEEILPVNVHGLELKQDVGPRPNQTMEALAKLRPVFQTQGGTVTAGNSSQITDGAVALIVCLKEEADRRGWKPLGYIKDYAISGLDPKLMGLGPAYSIHQLLLQNQQALDFYDRFEINEAFACQVLACQQALASPEFNQLKLGRTSPVGMIDPARLNTCGGAIALGHPVGATGARLILSLLLQLRRENLNHGLASLCVGGGQGVAMWLSTQP